MAKTITICGKELQLTYSLRAAVSYEKMTGKSALYLEDFQKEQITPFIEIGYCMLLASNPVQDVPQLEDILRDMDTGEKMRKFVGIVGQELMQYFKPEKSEENKQDEGGAKNA